jgi:pullulanase/glycogen debranching enzyme
MSENETEAFWFIWSNGDASRVYVGYPKDLKDKPEQIAKFLEKEWLRYPCKVTYRGQNDYQLRAFFIDLKDGKTQ